MKKSRFTEAQIMGVLRQAEGGMPVPELCRGQGIRSATPYRCRATNGGMDAYMMSQMKALGDKNRRRKRLLADVSKLADLLREALGMEDYLRIGTGRSSWSVDLMIGRSAATECRPRVLPTLYLHWTHLDIDTLSASCAYRCHAYGTIHQPGVRDLLPAGELGGGRGARHARSGVVDDWGARRECAGDDGGGRCPADPGASFGRDAREGGRGV